MKIYFSASIAGGRKFLDTYKKIVEYLKSKSHIVLTEHIILDNLLEFENKLSPEAIYQRDVKMLQQCDVMIAEVSNPSLGVGYEIRYAENLHKPVLCIYHAGIFVSRMIVGNKSPLLSFGEYSTYEAMMIHIDNFLNAQ